MLTSWPKRSQATKYLINVKIQTYAESLCTRIYTTALSDGLGMLCRTELHDNGINIRNSGYIRSLLLKKLLGVASLRV
jgi:hypothetical protein